MSLPLLFLMLIGIAVYWTMTQILPERRRVQLLRPSLAGGILEALNEQRHARGLPVLELDEELLQVAEAKAGHQFLTGVDDEGWDYPSSFAGMFGRSLLMEVLISGPAPRMAEKLAKQTDVLDGEWITCGIGVAGGRSDQVVVAMVLCREAWDAIPVAAPRRSLLERLALGE